MLPFLFYSWPEDFSALCWHTLAHCALLFSLGEPHHSWLKTKYESRNLHLAFQAASLCAADTPDRCREPSCLEHGTPPSTAMSRTLVPSTEYGNEAAQWQTSYTKMDTCRGGAHSRTCTHTHTHTHTRTRYLCYWQPTTTVSLFLSFEGGDDEPIMWTCHRAMGTHTRTHTHTHTHTYTRTHTFKVSIPSLSFCLLLLI